VESFSRKEKDLRRAFKSAKQWSEATPSLRRAFESEWENGLRHKKMRRKILFFFIKNSKINLDCVNG